MFRQKVFCFICQSAAFFVIVVKNFKTFKDEIIEFDKLNILIGANASGKSNTISLFRFINNVIEYGIENAISLAGGTEYLLNTKIGKEQPLYISFICEMADEKNVQHIVKKKNQSLVMGNFEYCFEIRAHRKGSGFSILRTRVKTFIEVIRYCSPSIKTLEPTLGKSFLNSV